jgi:hypothetical protein
MTAQFGERLIYRGENITVYSEPLHGYLAQRSDIQFRSPSTACWRGYIGTWALKGGANKDIGLYLIELKAHLDDWSEVGLDYVFPEAHPEGIFAHWFTGDLNCPQGEILEYVHMGYASVYEEELILSFNKGILVHEETFRNERKRKVMDANEDINNFEIPEFLKKKK